jgi:hypothetical protein
MDRFNKYILWASEFAGSKLKEATEIVFGGNSNVSRDKVVECLFCRQGSIDSKPTLQIW